MGDLEYNDVVQELRGAYNPGRLKLQSTNVMFRNSKTGLVDQYQSSDIDKVSWLKRARGNCLKIQLNNGTTHRYDGLKESEYETLSSYISTNYDKDLQKVDLSVKGWNWGTVAFEGNNMEFLVGQKMAFEIPLGNVSHATTAKNEVTLEFHVNDDAAVSLVEMRFHVPTDPTAEVDAVEDFYNNVIEKADVLQATGDAVATFPDIHCLTPRGRYEIKVYPTFLQLHGKTFDYKVPYTTILRLFLLPHKDQMFFVMSLDPPIKHGQTRYHFLILLFAKDDEMTIELALTEKEVNEKYDGKLSPEMSGPEYEIVSRIFKAMTNRKITVPGNFSSNQKHHCVSCSYRAAMGLLYPLERGFIFLHKPSIHVRFDEIACLNFARSVGSTKSFDFDIETTSGTTHTFNGIEKDEYRRLFDFVTSKKLRLKNVEGKLGKGPRNLDDMEASDNEETPDNYLEMMKAEGRDKVNDDMGEDSDDSSDESFNPGESGSEVAEEYDSNPPTTDSSDESDNSSQGASDKEAAKQKKEAKRLEKEKKKKKLSKPKTAQTVSEGKTRKRRKDKDPNRPKRPQTAYFIWLNENRDKIKADNPGISITEISKKAGELWKGVTDKSKYEKLAHQAKEEYAVAMEEYNKGEKYKPTESPVKKTAKSSPKKPSTIGTGSNFKSEEFVMTSSGSSSGEESRPLKKPKNEVKNEPKDENSEAEASESEEEKTEKSPKKATRKSRRQNKRGTDSEESSSAGELPDEEEELKTPTASEQSSSGEDE